MKHIKKLALLILAASLVLLPACEQRTADISPTPDDTVSPPRGLVVYFLDVGQADAAFIECDGEYMLVDGGNAADSDLVYSFLKNHEADHLKYIIGTHAHEDHIGGLSGALAYASVDTAYCPVTEFDSTAFNNFVRRLGEQGKAITVPNPGGKLTLGTATIEIIGPLKQSNNTNNTSIVFKLSYGEVSFLFTGDCERDEESDILEAGYDISATVLKVAHHGSDTSTSYPFLRAVMPQYAVISCGKDNSYKHPHDDTLSKLRDADVLLYRTDLQGMITATSDGSSITFITERNANVVTNPTSSVPAYDYYIGNVKTQKLHSPDCGNLPSENNRVYFDTLDEALAAGYEKHSTCLP